jgi:hypothetical protein
MTDVTNHPMWPEQERLEHEMTSLGVSRFRRVAMEAYQEGEATKAGGEVMARSHVSTRPQVMV